MMEWQPIETAPHDESLILVGGWKKANGVVAGWVSYVVCAGFDEFHNGERGMSRCIAPFTHWIPLPEPPEVSQ